MQSGACGACTVIIDGETCRACVPTTDTLEGRNIITVEGLTDWESKVYTYAYGEAGAVQCGFCIPGMVMCTKALLDKNPDPTEAEIRYAIRNNYCRCTGYVKIIAAIRLAAKIKREGIIPEDSATDWKIGSRVHRLDVEEKSFRIWTNIRTTSILTTCAMALLYEANIQELVCFLLIFLQQKHFLVLWLYLLQKMFLVKIWLDT